jgi:hypothetical protein
VASAKPLGLFPRVLGRDWDALPDVVKRGHELEPEMHGHGAFTIVHGASWILRLAARMMGMPPAGDHVPTRLDVVSEGGELVWRRDFGGTHMDSRMYEIDGGRIAERRGPIEICMRITARDGAIVYRSDTVRLRIGPLRIPFPSFLAPRIEGRVWADGAAMHTRIRIDSWMGMIVTYEGPLELG